MADFKPKERVEKKRRAEREAEDLIACAEASVLVDKKSKIQCKVCHSDDSVHYSGCPETKESMLCYCGKHFCRYQPECYEAACRLFRLSMDISVEV